MLVLAIGDLYVPERTSGIPAQFKKLLQPRGKIDKVLCLGNITNSPSTLEFLKNLSEDFQIVCGENDSGTGMPSSLVFQIGRFKIGLINGFQVIPKNDPLSLLSIARMMDVNILISGSTHKIEAYTLDGKFFVNPGTGTGAYSTEKVDHEDMEYIRKTLNERLMKDSEKPEDIRNGKEGTEVKEGEFDQDQVQVQDQNPVQDPAQEQDVQTEINETAEKDDSSTPILTSQNVNTSTIDQTSQKLEGMVLDSDGSAAPAQPETKPSIPKESSVNELNPIDEYLAPCPSFCLLDVQEDLCVLYLYMLVDGEVKIDKLTYRIP